MQVAVQHPQPLKHSQPGATRQLRATLDKLRAEVVSEVRVAAGEAAAAAAAAVGAAGAREAAGGHDAQLWRSLRVRLVKYRIRQERYCVYILSCLTSVLCSS